MATSKKSTPEKTPKVRKPMSDQQRLLLGSFIVVVGLLCTISFASFFFTGDVDQSVLSDFGNRESQAENVLNKLGAALSDFFVRKGLGASAFFIGLLFIWTGIVVIAKKSIVKLKKRWFWGLYLSLLFSIFFALVLPSKPILGGTVGFESVDWLNDYLGHLGTSLLLALGGIVYLTLRLKYALKYKPKEEIAEVSSETIEPIVEEEVKIELTDQPSDIVEMPPMIAEEDVPEPELLHTEEGDIAMEVTRSFNEKEESHNLADKLVADFGEVDPTLELSNFRMPPLNLLKHYDTENITIDQEELKDNKDRIVETLNNYNIGISNIKATIGPTVTMYEIVPDAGIRISKIKNLEDDIALSLSALGIRIIAPIPGKGTIGIEVPNKKPTIVSMRSLIASQKFQKAEMELPIAVGKTISNETFVVDLAKMPHLLMAGATGQGKSVGLNAILTSLLYKKHPAEVKFVLVDPKKVELTLFNKIERHYLAKLPDTEEAIITDTSKVVQTLNSLCMEMDQRYELLKLAMCRNIIEYNEKYKSRKLNPEYGHHFLPYIVLVVDEFADLIMTAGKEVETPIARLAQLARAIGIHLIIATQRPSVNVITGLIKANFSARIAFRVASKIDSRTILDNAGANQLIGRGDLLFTQGNETIRLQCAFIDTTEVEEITSFIGAQKAYPDAYLLPEFVGEEGGSSMDMDPNDRDDLFYEAAQVVVIHQQGSASLLQRKLKLGYNRAGRIIDQLESAGIVGPFEGSKARQVLINDIAGLDAFLNNQS
jgi:S-DNA-T family DNA segregation ATPase FtsK/SpoIIIE